MADTKRDGQKQDDQGEVKPFGLQFLETVPENELEAVAGGTFHSMDIFRSHGVWHYNT